MKATLQFNLPEESQEHKVAVHAVDLYLTLWDIDQWLRGKIKYSEGKEYSTYEDAFEDARRELREIMASHNVNLEMMS